METLKSRYEDKATWGALPIYVFRDEIFARRLLLASGATVRCYDSYSLVSVVA